MIVRTDKTIQAIFNHLNFNSLEVASRYLLTLFFLSTQNSRIIYFGQACPKKEIGNLVSISSLTGKCASIRKT